MHIRATPTLVLRPDWETLSRPLDLNACPTPSSSPVGFVVQLTNRSLLGLEAHGNRSSSPSGWCRPHTASSDLLIVWSLSTWPVLDHPQSSAPGLLLLPWPSSLPAMPYLTPTYHETSKHDSPHKIDNKAKAKITKMSWIRIQTRASQWLITIKPRYWPLGFWISSLMSPLITQKHNVWILNPRPNEAQLEDQKIRKVQEGHLE
jgi:hypothetical protein